MRDADHVQPAARATGTHARAFRLGVPALSDDSRAPRRGVLVPRPDDSFDRHRTRRALYGISRRTLAKRRSRNANNFRSPPMTETREPTLDDADFLRRLADAEEARAGRAGVQSHIPERLRALATALPGFLEDRERLNALGKLVGRQDVSLLGTSRGGVVLSSEDFPSIIGEAPGLRSTLDGLRSRGEDSRG